MAPRSAITAGSPRRIEAASPRAKNTRPGPRTAALHSFVVPLCLVASTDGAATFQLVPASTAPRRPFRRLRAPGTRARKQLRSLRSLRVAALLAPTPRDLRSAPSSLHSDREPPGSLRLAIARRLTRRAAIAALSRGSTRLRLGDERGDDFDDVLLMMTREDRSEGVWFKQL
jgi:hypothetical protein